MKLLLSQINPNPHRDMTKYPLIGSKIDALVESIYQTDFWDNLLCRITDNMYDGKSGDALVEFLKGCDKGYNDKGIPLFTVEIAYGHHRLEAAKRAGLTEIDIPCKVIGGEVMLKIMANENRSEWSTNLGVMFETVRQVKIDRQEKVDAYDDFDEFVEEGHDWIKGKSAWSNIKKSGVGAGIIHKFLGETWNDTEIKTINSVLESIEKARFPQEDAVAMGTLTMVRAFNTLITNLQTNPYPVPIMDAMYSQIYDLLTDEKKPVTSRTVEQAASASKKPEGEVTGKDPIIKIKTGKSEPFSLYKWIKELCVDSQEKFNDLQLAIADFPNADEDIAKFQKFLDKPPSAGGAGGGGKEGEDGDATDGGDSTQEQADLEKAIKAAEDKKADALAGKIDGVDEDTEIPVPQLVTTYTTSVNAFLPYAVRLLGRINDLEPDSVFEQSLVSTTETLFKTVLKLAVELHSSQEVQGIVNDALGIKDDSANAKKPSKNGKKSSKK